MPGPAAIAIVVVAMARFRNSRRDEAAALERSTPLRLGKCVQPNRSHMLVLPFHRFRSERDKRSNPCARPMSSDDLFFDFINHAQEQPCPVLGGRIQADRRTAA